ncbi:TPA: hypothetical protein HA265_03740 [Candidatus Woesearchaeota archaeon]|nr:hypothetical protein [Candidatus Woesearchaeota archaeon]
MCFKEFIMPDKKKLIAPIAVAAFFLLMILGKIIIPKNSVPSIFLYPFLFTLLLSIPLWPLLTPLDLWSSVAVWDSSGPTTGGFMITAIFWVIVSYLVSCLVVFLYRRKSHRKKKRR